MKNPFVIDATAKMLMLSDDIGHVIATSKNTQEVIDRLKAIRKDIDQAIELSEALDAHDKKNHERAAPLIKQLETLSVPVQFVVASNLFMGKTKDVIIEKLQQTEKVNTDMLENGDFDDDPRKMKEAIQAQKDFPRAIEIMRQVQAIEDGEA